MVVRGQTGGLSEYAAKVGRERTNISRLVQAAEVAENVCAGAQLLQDKTQHLSAIHSLPESCWQPAVEAMLAGEDALPMTFVDFAELVWRRIDAGETQQAVADAIGWSREAVKDYSSLAKIAPAAWEIVGATIREAAPISEIDAAPEFGATAPFTAGLLRSILPLTADQQVELVRRNLTAAWRIELQLANKDDLAKIGAAKRAHGMTAPGKTLLSQNDKSVDEPKHNTRAEIAKAANTSTGMIGMAEVRRWNT